MPARCEQKGTVSETKNRFPTIGKSDEPVPARRHGILFLSYYQFFVI